MKDYRIGTVSDKRHWVIKTRCTSARSHPTCAHKLSHTYKINKCKMHFCDKYKNIDCRSRPDDQLHTDAGIQGRPGANRSPAVSGKNCARLVQVHVYAFACIILL